MKYICDVSTRDELAIFLDIPIKKLTHQLYIKKPDLCYASFEIKKKNGDSRQIHAPSDDLMSIQRKIANALWEYEKALRDKNNIKSNISHAFEKDKSIFSNAKPHRNKRFVLNLDLKNFFPSIHFGRVMGFFMKNKNYKMSYEVAVILAQLCCYKGELPQGAPTSPIISNLICQILDMRLLKLANEYKVNYTRYADDLTFSTNNKLFLDKQDEFLEKVTAEINHAGFTVNDKKTRFQYKDSKQVVTGLIVNKKINIDRNYYRDTRAMAQNLYANGKFFINGIEGTINQLEGRFSFINQIDKYNNNFDLKCPYSVNLRNGSEENFRRFKFEAHNLRNLNGREEQYRKFLFYKYFYANEKPIIVTEGKTDKLYLKAALKNLYKEYPDLIEKTDGKYNFKIRFLNRSKRLAYFFGLGSDGADSMKNLYNFFSDDTSFKNYYRVIAEKSFILPSNPVIFIFDNEINNKNKPLYSFANYAKLTQVAKDKLSKGGYYKLDTIHNIMDNAPDITPEKHQQLVDHSNLYLLTIQLVNGKEECEIEDLFDKDTLSHEENGRTFSRKDEDKEKYYNKDIFSRYIFTNYKNIDFSNFKPMLDSLNEIVAKYHELKQELLV